MLSRFGLRVTQYGCFGRKYEQFRQLTRVLLLRNANFCVTCHQCNQPKKQHVFLKPCLLSKIQIREYLQITGPASLNQNKEFKLKLEDDGKQVKIHWKDGTQSKFHSIWLRHNCHCHECMQDYSGQKLLDGSKVDPKILLQSVEVYDSGTRLNLKWQGLDHLGVIPLEYLKDYCYSCKKDSTPQMSEMADLKTLPEMEYNDMVNSRHGLLRWMRYINTYGMCLLKDVPTEEGMVAKVAECIAPVVDNIYGKVFDVVSTPDPINVAYSSAELDFHMDLVYYESSPRIQFLHCLK